LATYLGEILESDLAVGLLLALACFGIALFLFGFISFGDLL